MLQFFPLMQCSHRKISKIYQAIKVWLFVNIVRERVTMREDITIQLYVTE